MSKSDKEKNAKLQKKRVRILAGFGLGALVTAICPPAGVILGTACFLGNARKVAQNPDDDEALTNLFINAWNLSK